MKMAFACLMVPLYQKMKLIWQVISIKRFSWCIILKPLIDGYFTYQFQYLGFFLITDKLLLTILSLPIGVGEIFDRVVVEIIQKMKDMKMVSLFYFKLEFDKFNWKKWKVFSIIVNYFIFRILPSLGAYGQSYSSTPMHVTLILLFHHKLKVCEKKFTLP